MFLDKSNELDFWTALEGGMRKNALFDKSLQKEQIDEALNYLVNAVESLNQAGLNKEAEMVLVLKNVCEDPHTKGLTSEKMLENLKEKGIVFNADDVNLEDINFEDEDDVEM